MHAPADASAATRAALDAALPRNAHQLSNDAYQGFLVPSRLDVAVQLTVTGGPNDDFEAFFDGLRADPARVDAYNALKRAWDGQPMDAYREAKQAFVLEALGRQE